MFKAVGVERFEATVQVNAENTTVAPNKYLEVILQARMCLHRGRDQGEALLQPLDQLGRIC